MAKELQVLIILLLIGFSLGCSGTVGNPAQPEGLNIPAFPQRDSNSNSQRQLWGMWDIYLDTENLVATAVPARDIQAHFNITQMVTPPACNDCIKLIVNSFDPVTRILDVDVTLRNPSSMSARDVRGILYYFDKYGHELTNYDDCTTYWLLPDSNPYNPFKAFAKDQPKRTFAGLAQYTEKYLIYIPIPPDYSHITYAVDASWPGNCREPYSIENFIQENDLYDYYGSKCQVSVDVLDWQNDVDAVQIFAPNIVYLGYVDMSHSAGNTWTAEVTNEMNDITIGDHNALVIATSANSGETPLVDIVRIKVTEKPLGWARTWGGGENDYGNSVAVDDYGNIYVTGAFLSSTVDFDPGSGADEHTSNGSYDVFLCKYDNNGVFQWARTWGGSDNDSWSAISIDGEGNIYAVGIFWFTVDFDPGPGVCEKTAIANQDAYMSKFDPEGNFVWNRTWGGGWGDGAYAVAANDSSDVLVSGSFGGTVDFDPDPVGVHEATAEGYYNTFVSKFDSDGVFQWVQIWNGEDIEPLDICLDESGNIFVAGYYVKWADFDPGPGVEYHWASGSSDAYLGKFDSEGNYQWARTWGGADATGFFVAIDSSQDIYVAGWFNGSADFDPSDGTDVHDSNGDTDMYISKFNTAGEYQQVIAFGSDGADGVRGLAIDKLDNMYIAGYFSGTLDFDPGPGVDERTPNVYADAYLWKSDSSGSHQWVRTWGGTEYDVCLGLAVDDDGNAFATGEYMGTCDFDPGPGVDQHNTNGFWDVFLVKYPPDGDW